MSTLVERLGGRIVGVVERVSSHSIIVQVEPSAPQATALNTGVPSGFPRINGYLLVPNESGATIGTVTEVNSREVALSVAARKDATGLVDLPASGRIITLIPLGTLVCRVGEGDDVSYELLRGVDVFPAVGDPVLVPTTDQLRAIVVGEEDSLAPRIKIGVSSVAGKHPVYVNPNKLFGRHLAVVGNTGAGKSCTVAGLVRWSIEGARAHQAQEGDQRNANARFIILDPNGEYATALGDLNPRVFRVGGAEDDQPLQVPAWMWNGNEWTAFTGAAPGVQQPLLLNALRRLRSTPRAYDIKEWELAEVVSHFRNQLAITRSSGDYSSYYAVNDYDRLMKSIVKEFRVQEEKVLDAKIKGALAQLNGVIASVAGGRNQGDGFAPSDIGNLLEAFNAVAKVLGLPDTPTIYGEDIPIEFPVSALPRTIRVLSSSLQGRDKSQYTDTLNLRIQTLLSNESLASITAATTRHLKLDQWLDKHIGCNDAVNGEVAILDLSLVPFDVLHIVVAVLSRVIFEAIQRHQKTMPVVLPTVLVLDEAHTFLSSELKSTESPNAGSLCCRTFERIAREGRKFGLGLVIASQRPSEVSPTVLSQCNTFLLHRIVNDKDQELMRRLVPDGLGAMLRELPSLPSRRGILLGWAVAAPLLVEVRELPEGQRPRSDDPEFWEVWTRQKPCDADWEKVVESWVSPSED